MLFSDRADSAGRGERLTGGTQWKVIMEFIRKHSRSRAGSLLTSPVCSVCVKRGEEGNI